MTAAFRPLALLMSPLLATFSYADTVSEFTLPGGATVTIVESPFSEAGFRLSNCSPEGYNCLINGRIPFGTVSTPTTYVKSISISYAGRTHRLDPTDMYNAWGSRTPTNEYFGGRCWDESYCHVRGLFSDGGGSFVAEWLVWEGVSTRTVISASGDVVDLFLENLDPPDYE